MGMYDMISSNLAKRIITKCPLCNHNIIEENPKWDSDEWQTKDFDCLLSILDLKDIIEKDNGKENIHEMHAICNHCNQYISVVFDLADNHITISTHNSSSSSTLEDENLKNEYLIEITRYENDKINKAFSEYGVALLNRLSIDPNEVDIDNLDKYFIIPKDNV